MMSFLVFAPLLVVIGLNLPPRSMTRGISFWLALILFAFQGWVVFFPPAGFLESQAIALGSLFTMNLVVDKLSLILILSIGIVAFSALLVGECTIKDRNLKFNFINLLLISVAGMNGIVMVQDLFTLYVFIEIVAVSSYIMIALYKDGEALEGAFKYILLSAIATIMMLSSVSLLMLTTGSTSFMAVSSSLKNGVSFLSMIAVVIFVCGLFIKGGLVPFHGWLPDAYSSAPSAVSVLLAGIVTKTTGIYTIIRLLNDVFGYTDEIKAVLLFVGAVSILVGALAALGQKDFKRMLAYSSISQVGYIILSLGTGTPMGIAGAVFHLFNHSIFKTQLFVNAAAVEEEAGTRDMDKVGGLSYRMPITGATSVIGLLSTAGIPPLAGFWSKFLIILALWMSGNEVYAVIAVAASLLTLAYFLSMQRRVFFGELARGCENVKEANMGIVVPEVVLALATIGFGVFFQFILDKFLLPF
jgi:proton-translocating NADH-quinone oxidoreductase chain M